MVELREYQKDAVMFLKSSLMKYGAAIDASDTGTGKTYVACQVAKDLGLNTLVICPKSMKTKWRELLIEFGVERYNVETLEYFILNYDKKNWDKGLLIWDECHRGQANYSTKTAKLMARIRDIGWVVLLISATAITNPLKMRATAKILGLYERDYFKWIIENGCYPQPFGGFKLRNASTMQNIHKKIFNMGKGIRVRIEDLPKGSLPDNIINIEQIDISSGVIEEIEQIRERTIVGDIIKLEYITHSRMLLESAKLEYIKDKTVDLVESGKNVVIFLSYLKSIEELVNSFTNTFSPKYKNIVCRVITGDTSESNRVDAIRSFQNNESNVIIMQLACGGVGLSLHDESGDKPRVSLINPDFSAINLKQALGRIHRNGGKSICIQNVILTTHPLERLVMCRLSNKTKEISLGNDGILDKEDLLEVFDEYLKGDKQ